MSLALHRLGRFIGRHRLAVIGVWTAVLLLIGGVGFGTGAAFEDDNSIPGTESQEGQDVLATRFGSSASGASAQLLFRADDGDITGADDRAVMQARLDRIAAVDGVAGVSSVDGLTIDDGGDAALANVQFDDRKPSESVLDAVQDAAAADTDGVTSTIGGSAYNIQEEQSHLGEVIGLAIALLVLIIVFGSLLAAGMPLVGALTSVGTTLGALFLASHLTAISPSTSAFSSMLGLAVAIDYSLFVLSRHRHELARGQSPQEAMARALGTAGSAVVFAGITVVIALGGLLVVGIPTLTTMAVGGALAVTMGVLVALTLLPAVALLAGARLRPRDRARSTKRASRPPLAQRWVRLVTRAPAITIVLVVLGLGVVAVPTMSMQLGLRDASTQPVGTIPRDHYDAIAASFGPGWNAPLLITADVLSPSNPVEVVDQLQDDLEELDGVVAVPLATPNTAGDTALFRVIPEGGQNDPRTADLVAELRAEAAAWEEQYGISDIRVTGTTAVNIDISARMQAALVPFTLTVVGLSLVLLLLVFRSIWVPIKATLGFLLSVGASFGAIVAIFQWGWFPALLGGDSPGPLVSFLPILVMGVLFGLAMDYEMFLVSRMREEYSHIRDPRAAVTSGFEHSAPVVTAAAVIMISVFVAFIPGGTDTIKPIAVGLAVGVFVDAFLVRMTLVPAIMLALHRHAWWLPRWLDRILPTVDIEGEAVMRQAAVDDGPVAALALSAGDLRVDRDDVPLTLDVRFGEAVTIDDTLGHRLAPALSGRAAFVSGTLVVAGRVLPDSGAAVRGLTAVVSPDDVSGSDTARRFARTMIALAGGGRRRRRRRLETVEHLVPDLDVRIADLDLAGRQMLSAAVAYACGARVIFFPVGSRPDDIHALTSAGASVVIVREAVAEESSSPLEIGASA
ncbi:MMPL family transporter [Microbacterium enclense]|nr:MMPL family transporter [Microbacterium enclense]